MYKYSVVTMIYNDYDILHDPLVVDKNAEYICLTDNKELKSDIWKIIYLSEYDTDVLTGVQKTYMTKYSVFGYVSSKSKYVIQIDASVLITNSLNPVFDYFEKNHYEMGLCIHPENNDFIQEYLVWMAGRGTNPKYLIDFVRYVFNHPYKNFSANNTGLILGTIKIYKNKQSVRKFVNDIYYALKEEANFSDPNDKCIFTYILYKYINKIKTLFFRCNLHTDGLYMETYFHKNNETTIPPLRIETEEEFNYAKLFGKTINIKSFNDNLYKS